MMEWSKISHDNLPPFDELLMVGNLDKEQFNAETGYFRGYDENGFNFSKKLDSHINDLSDVFMGRLSIFQGTHFFVVELPKDLTDGQEAN